MSEMVPLRCPRCLTDGQAPAELERLVCPVCESILAWGECGYCGGRHLGVEGEPLSCPNGPTVPVAPSFASPLSRPTATPPSAALPPTAPAPLGGPVIPGAQGLTERPEKRSRRTVFLVLAVVVAVAAAVVAFILIRSDDDGSGARRSVEQVVRESLESNPDALGMACEQVSVLGGDRAKVTEMLDSLPANTRDAMVESLRQRGEQEGWLPDEATTWQFPELRLAILTLFDECASNAGG